MKKKWLGVITLISLFIVQIISFYLLSLNEIAVAYFTHFFEWKKEFHVRIFSSINLSVGDIFYFFIFLLIVFQLIQLFKSKQKRIRIFSSLIIILNIFYFSYQVSWGMLYFEPPIIDKLSKEPNIDEVKKIYSAYAIQANKLRDSLPEDKNGVYIIRDTEKLKNDLIKAQKALPKSINSKNPIGAVSIKKSLLTSVINKSGLLGYYNPFSAEAQYNGRMPGTMRSFTMAHEVAHQLGYAREYEASFIAYLLSTNSNNKDLEYSTTIFVLKSLAGHLSKVEPAYLKADKTLSKKVIRDLQNERIFRLKNKSVFKTLFLKSNDLFLKTNRQSGSISYSYFIRLFLRYNQ